MELALQPILAQLYTNAELRSRFFTNPEAVGAQLGLNTTQIQQLAQLSAPAVNLFATSLKRKRLGEVRELLPMTAKALDKEFSKLFWQYAETYIPQGIKKHLLDAIAFASYIEKVANIAPDWILDLVRYEKAWLEAAEPNKLLLVRRFRYAVNSSEGHLQQPFVALWFRLSQRGKLKCMQVRSLLF
ncbi:hypothetical protein [Aliterella atlantica]|uniref:SCO6045-like C-terminal domain-containing protein n=1 Tax=Aliterella atlantica CENA595 TaxID=1618023 RepID=A0A0D8ZW82_9CYAN|nr:hypothetical protein [Aliterella atlantica]KJH73038.1 hypothetical protein UH38_02915 [Aliterella atlantica CENA595]